MKKKEIAIGGQVPQLGAEATINLQIPYRASVTITGKADFLYHKWNCEAIEAKANAPKGSEMKKIDNLESYVYRTDLGELAIPGENFRQSIIKAAKFKQDPRSPRKSAEDLYKAGISILTVLSPVGKEAWDYEDRRRVVVQKSAITRVRPALKAGWQVTFELLVNLPEYIPSNQLLEAISLAGRVIGIGDFRPTYGRYQVTNFEVLNEQEEQVPRSVLGKVLKKMRD